MKRTRRDRNNDILADLTVVHKLEDIPKFANEDEEDEFWSTHELAGHLFTRQGPSARVRRTLGMPPVNEEQMRRSGSPDSA